MARKRIIDPEFWSDEEIGKWPYEVRLFYIGLWNFADDSGRFKAHSSLLKSQIFPYDSKINIDKLKIRISSKIQWYLVSGSQYGFIRNFLKHQRIDKPTISKLPTPPPFDESSTNDPGILPPNTTKDKLIEGKRKEESFPPSLEDIQEFCTNKNIAIDTQKMYSYYCSNGWKVGRNPMVSWRDACWNWSRNDFNKKPDDPGNGIPVEFRTKR